MELGTFVFFAILIERVIEYFVKPRLDSKYIIYVALVLAFAVSFGYKLDLIATLGLATEGALGYAFTAVVLAGGSNFLNDIIGRVRKEKAPAS